MTKPVKKIDASRADIYQCITAAIVTQFEKACGPSRYYLSVKLDDPSFRLYATLIEIDGKEGLSLI